MSFLVDDFGREPNPIEAKYIARRILRARRRASQSRVRFRDWLPIASPHFSWGSKHFQLIARTLEQVAAGEIRRLIITAPPRSGKSEIATIHFPIWLLEGDPTFQVLVGTYNADKAAEFGRDARKLGRRRLPSLDPERQAASDWHTLEGGKYRAVGRDTPPTGKGFDGLIVDDAFRSSEEAASRAKRDRAWTWFERDLMQRLEPRAFAVINSTRWDEDDLIGRILNGANAKSWTVLDLPALAGDNDPAGREPGEVLWPERWPIEEYEALWLDMTPETRSTVYFNNPIKPGGRALAVEKIVRRSYKDTPLWMPGDPLLKCDRCGARAYRSRLANLDRGGDVAALRIRHECGGELVPIPRSKRCRAWDLAHTVRHNADYTVGALLEGPDPDGFIYWLDTVRVRMAPAERNRVMRETAERDGRETKIRIPVDNRGDVGKEIASQLITLLTGYTVIALAPKGAKVLRAEPLATTMDNGQLVLVEDSEWPEFWDGERQLQGRAAHAIARLELKAFPPKSKRDHDDIPDAMADAHNECTRKGASVYL